LAVAKGRFPIQLDDFANQRSDNESKSKDEDEASSVRRPIIGGPKGYWAMIQAICDDDPPVAGKLFSEKFNDFISCCLKKKPESRCTSRELLKLPFIADSLRSPRHPASIFKPAKTRDVEEDVVEDFHEFGFSDLHNVSESSKEPLSPEDEHSLIYAIRLEHLDRLLDRIVEKLTLKSAKKSSAVGYSVNSIDFGSGDENEVEIGDSLSPPQSILKQGRSTTGKYPVEDAGFSPAVELPTCSKVQSLRTVHFQEDAAPTEERKSVNLRGNRLKKLDLKIQVEEVEEKCDDIASKLPKTSSYFLNSGTFEDIPPAGASTDSEFIDFDYSSEDLKKMLPNFDDKGLRKWKNLANQLNLPVQIVLIAAKSKLAGVYERLAEKM
jgi:serine/threonine protein kinase